jgi:hypothetical protein
MAAGRARRLVGLATTSHRCARTRESWAAGDVSIDQAHRLLEASDTAPEQFAEAEESLLDIVTPLSASQTRMALSYWVHTVTDAAPDDDRRGISLSQTFGGMAHLDGWLTPVAYETLRTALEALTPPQQVGDERSARQRRHDAMEDLARSLLDSLDAPIVGGERPHINLVCDLDALKAIAGGRHETEDGAVVDVTSLRTVACDSSVSRVILGPDSEIIDVGRRTRVIPTALRRAIIARDRHCTHPGCERLPRWCDVHHDTHWAEGGPTNQENCRLLCRFHHTLNHHQSRRGPPV